MADPQTKTNYYRILLDKQRIVQEKLYQHQLAVREQELRLCEAKEDMHLCLEELERMEALLRSNLWVTAEEHEIITDYSAFIEAHFCESQTLVTEIMGKLNDLVHAARIQADQLKHVDDLLEKADKQGQKRSKTQLDNNTTQNAAWYIFC